MSSTWICQVCGNDRLEDDGNGFCYCTQCNSQVQDYQETGVADEDFHDKAGDARGGLYSAFHKRPNKSTTVKTEPLSQPLDHYYDPFSQTKTADHNAADVKGPTEPNDFGSSGEKELSKEDCYTQIRRRYVLGVQRMVELQCEALVRKFKVNPLICGLSGTIWLRFVAGTRIFDDYRDDLFFDESEICQQGELPEGFNGIVWFRSLRNKIPLSYSLAVTFLACHLSREAVLPTDIVKWSVEGNLPYFSAFLEIEKYLEKPSLGFPISSSLMFRPSESVPVQKLESLAAIIAESIGLHLPPVNFYAIASRYLNKLSLPVEKILPHACRIYEWSMPPELWLSTNELRLPTRIFVMSILIVAVRILYNIHGFGEWEKSLSSKYALSSTSNQIGDLDPTSSSRLSSGAEEGSGSPSHSLDDSGTKLVRSLSNAQNSELDAAELLSSLEEKYKEISDTYEYCKDLPTYLNFCKDLFAGSNSSFKDHKEKELIELLWNFYQSGKDSEIAVEQGLPCGDHSCCSSQNSQYSEANDAETLKDEAIRRMKLDMEEKRLYYIPPRINLKRFDYLHYVRKKDEGAYTYAAHADYYMLLRSCARVAQVEIRCMHMGALSIERRLAWLENRINHCLQLTPPIVSCEYSTVKVPESATDAENNIEESIRLSQLNNLNLSI